MERLYLILSILAVFGIGYWRIRARLDEVAERIVFLGDFRDRFVDLVNSVYFERGFMRSHDMDEELYTWLTHNANRVQRELGSFGIVDYMPPLQRYHVSNYRLILNTLPKFRQGNVHFDDAGFVDDALNRRLGFDKEIMEIREKELSNPLQWFRYGIQVLLGFPVKLLEWFGIIGGDTSDKLISNWLFKLVSGIVALAGFVSSLITIFAGWDQSRDFLEKLFGK